MLLLAVWAAVANAHKVAEWNILNDLNCGSLSCAARRSGK